MAKAGPSDKKREQIVDAATRLFLSEGYADVSMDRVASEAGVSKATIYTRFDSRDALLDEVIAASCVGVDAPPLAFPPPDEPIESLLHTAAGAAAYRLVDPKVIAIVRLVLGASARFPHLGELFWNHGPKFAVDYAAEALCRHFPDLPTKSANRIALEFIDGVIGAHFLTAALGVSDPPDRARVDAAIDDHIQSLLKRLEQGTQE